jgi:transcription initiation factor TFIIIB Brf1 subunit/transcription initiation factor TFIIB
MWNRGPYREFTLWSIFDTLQVRASNAGIGGAVLEEAKELFAQLTAQAICRGQPQRDAMLAACIWEALKRHGTTRMPRDIAKIFAIDVKQVTKGIKQFQHLFAIRISGECTDTYTTQTTQTKQIKQIKQTKQTEVLEDKDNEKDNEKDKEKEVETSEITTARAMKRRAIWQNTVTRITTFDDFIKPYLTNLSIPRTKYTELYDLVRSVCAKTDELGIVPENTPPSLTASVIALCCKELDIRIEISEITHVCGISSVTIQKCMKRMELCKEKLFE